MPIITISARDRLANLFHNQLRPLEAHRPVHERHVPVIVRDGQGDFEG